MCNLCNNKEALNMPYTPFRLKVRENEIYIEKYYGDMEEWVKKDNMITKIKYCPMCGGEIMIKELKEVKRAIKVIRNYCEEKQCVNCKIKRYCSSSWHIKGKLYSYLKVKIVHLVEYMKRF